MDKNQAKVSRYKGLCHWLQVNFQTFSSPKLFSVNKSKMYYHLIEGIQTI